MNKTFDTLSLSSLLVTTLASASTLAAPLHITVYNPGEKAIFPVSSTLVSGQKEAILVDAQFSVTDGKALVDLIQRSGKTLTTVVISGGDPDYYFGLEPIKAAFPHVKVVATQQVIDHIQQTKDAKLAYWGPILGKQAPKRLFVPTLLSSSTLTLEGETLEIKERDTHQAYLWAPSIQTAFGGVLVSAGQHIWTADSQSQAARLEWTTALEHLAALHPKRVVPGHFLGTEPQGSAAVTFTHDYLKFYEQALSQSKNSGELIQKLKAAYPALPVDEGMAISAKVNTGEMKW
jgi:glyoxylase-like metal-dependent hydrolase (beta-lactamase superfamily II)